MNRLTGLSTGAFPSHTRSVKMVGATNISGWSDPMPSSIIFNRPPIRHLGVCRRSLQTVRRPF